MPLKQVRISNDAVSLYAFSILTIYVSTRDGYFFSSNYLRKVFIFGGDQACEKTLKHLGVTTWPTLKHKSKNSVCLLKVRRNAVEQHYRRSAWRGPTSMGSRHSSGAFYKPDFARYVETLFSIGLPFN